ncbi:MAG: hypothetical protein AAF587_12930 [Bacteroidota bacterium]
MQQLLTYASLLLAGGLIGFFIGKSNGKSQVRSENSLTVAQAVVDRPITDMPSQKDTTKDSTTESISNPNKAKTKEAVTESPKANVAVNSKRDNSAIAMSVEDPSPAIDKNATSALPKIQASKTTAAPVPASTPVTTDCITDEKEWSFHLSLFAENLEKQKIMYSQTPPEALTDCSGIFFRMVNFAASKCENYVYPDPGKTRDSRSLARWYYDNNNLNLVQDPLKSRNMIRPGSVMFFGRSGERYQEVTIDKIAGTSSVRGVISHIGVVTEVKRDDEGNVIGYVMMHGRRKGKIAERSHYHQIAPPRLGYPVLGNWNQQWVAVANIMTPKNTQQIIAENYVPTPAKKQTEQKKQDAPKAVPTPPAAPSAPIASSQTSLPETAACVKEEKAWSSKLTTFAEGLEQQKIMYTQTPPSAFADCSGIFFRMVNFAASQCGEYQYPDPSKTRDSRSIARWFHDNNNLVLVQDPMKVRHLIKPGSVMFFGRPNQRYSNLTIESMAGTPGKRGAIFHVGVVTEVNYDEQGNVIGYVLMHGKSTGKAAGRTHYHKVEPPRIGYPILGSWNQQWVAIANIMTPKAMNLASAN